MSGKDSSGSKRSYANILRSPRSVPLQPPPPNPISYAGANRVTTPIPTSPGNSTPIPPSPGNSKPFTSCTDALESVPLQLVEKTTTLSSNSEKKGPGRVTFQLPTDISTCGPPPPIPNPMSYAAALQSRSPNRFTTPIPTSPGNSTPIPPSPGNSKSGTVATCSTHLENVPLQLVEKTITLSSNSEKKGPGRVTFPFPTDISTCGSKKYPILFGTILAEIEIAYPTYVGQPSPVTPRSSEQLAGTEGLPSFRSPRKAEIPDPTYVGQPSPVTPRPEQLAGTEGLPSFRSPKKAEIPYPTYVGQPSPVTPRPSGQLPSEQLAGTEGLQSFRSPKKRNPDAARILYITFSLWGPDISPEEIFLYFESIMGADTVEDICLFSKLDHEGAKTTDAFVKFRNPNSVEILMGEAEVVEMKIFENTAHAKRHRG